MEKGRANPTMKRGQGPYSYAQNSSLQADAIASFKSTIYDVIVNNVEFDRWLSTSTNGSSFRIADFGCSTGPNTFTAMRSIVEALQGKYKSTRNEVVGRSEVPEFHVFFNDLVSNDFNTLFSSLPCSGGKPYFAAGVPGSFHGRLFPKLTLNVACCFSSLHWLSEVPKEVVDRNSPAWNKESIYFRGNAVVYEAFSTQYKKDVDRFLRFRAEEMTKGGILLLSMVQCLEEYGTYASKTLRNAQFELFGTCLKDMAKMARISEETVESFNLPLYFTSIPEFKEIIENNGCFSIERMEASVPATPYLSTAQFRAIFEDQVAHHFGDNIVDDLFELYDSRSIKISTLDIETAFNVFVCLKIKS